MVHPERMRIPVSLVAMSTALLVLGPTPASATAVTPAPTGATPAPTAAGTAAPAADALATQRVTEDATPAAASPPPSSRTASRPAESSAWS